MGDDRDDTPDGGLDLAVLAARTASNMKATDVVVLDVGAVLSIAGYFVIAAASNPRQVRAVVDEVESRVKSESVASSGAHRGCA